MFGYRLQNGFDFGGGGGDDAQDLARRRLLLQRFTELALQLVGSRVLPPQRFGEFLA